MELNHLSAVMAELTRGRPIKWVAVTVFALVEWALPTHELRNLALGAIAMIALDLVTGILAAIHLQQPFSSKRLGHTLVKLLGYLCVILACAAVTQLTPGLRGLHIPTQGAVLGLVVATEFTSLLINIERMGLPLPPQIKKLLDPKPGDSSESK